MTSNEINQWMQRQLAKVHEHHEYGHIIIEISQFRPTQTNTRFSIYTGSNGPNSGERSSIEACFERLESLKNDPAVIRKEAERFRSLAETYEQKAKQLEQQ